MPLEPLGLERVDRDRPLRIDSIHEIQEILLVDMPRDVSGEVHLAHDPELILQVLSVWLVQVALPKHRLAFGNSPQKSRSTIEGQKTIV